ncbi:hypothetical protein [Flavihumibacter sp. CACIAM 22H1]|uniref:hypothetical protein n=1 Tax=Flavihumibacter sp. CACIAM 22H1 TaxID=1812911 RepID=UPI0007A88D42|nr:hypothetical protein [Flavihumibacter sp. CACIAM 22H1]KYP15003.1 MAG: hypothetical protein A1D16_10180 [Flavihumibacter sp. CACIAM 22H1]
MKKSMRYVLLAVIGSLSLFSCDRSNDDDTDPTNTPANSVTNSYLSGGSWKLSLLTDGGVDETSDYEGYTFEFMADGKMTATRAGTTTNGTWRTQRDDGKNELLIQLVTTDKDLDELNDDWDIVLSTSSKIELQDDNEASNEKLHFTKK